MDGQSVDVCALSIDEEDHVQANVPHNDLPDGYYIIPVADDTFAYMKKRTYSIKGTFFRNNFILNPHLHRTSG